MKHKQQLANSEQKIHATEKDQGGSRWGTDRHKAKKRIPFLTTTNVWLDEKMRTQGEKECCNEHWLQDQTDEPQFLK